MTAMKTLIFLLVVGAASGVWLLATNGVGLANTITPFSQAQTQASPAINPIGGSIFTADGASTGVTITGSAGQAKLTHSVTGTAPLVLSGPTPGTAGVDNTFSVSGATPDTTVHFIGGAEPGSTAVPGCPGESIDIANPKVLGTAVADASGNASLTRLVPAIASGKTVRFQAAEVAACHVSNLVIHSFLSEDLAAVDLGTSGNYVILAKSGVSTTGVTSITGDIGVSPAAATSITGFDLILDASGEFSTSSLVTGKVFASDYAPPTPAELTTAVSDMETAYTDAAGRTNPDVTELGAGDISGLTLSPGLYKWGTGVLINGGVTLDCLAKPSAVFIFQIAGTLTVGDGAIVTLAGDCQAQNLFWQVADQTTLGTIADFKGNILDQTGIVLNTGAVLNGRMLTQTAATLDANAVTTP